MAKKTKEQSPLDIMASRKAANDFLKAGARNERRRGRSRGEGIRQWSRFSDMSDDDFDKGVADGSITPQQINDAGRYEYENWLDDVWSETDRAEDEPEPTYEQFMANPYKYGYNEDLGAENHLYRYNPGRVPDDSTDATIDGVPRHYAEGGMQGTPVPADNTAVAKKPKPEK